MVEEKNKSKCSMCQQIKPRIQDGKYPDMINKKWIDNKGELWVGRRCPECVRLNMKARMSTSRKNRKVVQNV